MDDSTSSLKYTHATAFEYSPLEPNAKRSILATSQELHSRLITVLSSSSYSDPVHCLIEPSNLADFDIESEDKEITSGYDAVSYVWGEAKFTHTLYCEKPCSHLMVTERLHKILLQLREDQRRLCRDKRCLWIDAVCTNQQDLMERSHQVQFMTQIYRRALQTHVFLGEKDDAANWLESEWFSRRWVIQEFIVSDNIVVHHNDHTDEPSSPSLPYNRRDRWDDLIQQLTTHPFETVDPVLLNTILKFDEFQRQGTKFLGILSLLLRFDTAKCIDPRDRLFSLIGIADNVSLRDADGVVQTGTRMDGNHKGIIDFTADYRMSTQEVYTIFARATLKTITPFDILHCAGAFRVTNPDLLATSSDTWPSWVPDWRLLALYKPLMKVSEFSESLDIKGRFRAIDVSDTALTITGLHLTTVRSLSTLITNSEFKANVDYRNAYPQERALLRPSSADDKVLEILALDRVFIEIEDGRWCAVPPDTLPGDDVVIFHGALTPFLLRSVPGRDVFRLIGDCYLKGGMYAGDPQRYSYLEDRRFSIV
jgi:hypothetical protein